MRKWIVTTMCLMIMAALSACGGTSAKPEADQTTTEAAAVEADSTNAGLATEGAEADVSQVEIKEVASEIYSQDDINAAIDSIITEFQANWSGCTLKEIYYAGDDVVKANADYAKNNDADEVMVLMSTFDVDSTGGANGSLDPDSTYKDWNWILVRKTGGEWKHVDHGY